MGKDVAQTEFSREDRTRYRQKVRRSLDVFERMLAQSQFDFERPMTGVEIELNLVDGQGDPALRNAEVLDAVVARGLPDRAGPVQRRDQRGAPDAVRRRGGRAGGRASGTRSTPRRRRPPRTGSHMVMIGILPTLTEKQLNAESLSANPRYALLNEQIFAARGEDLHIAIDGVQRLATSADTVAPEAACTSVQFHLQVSPSAFPRYWNAAQSIAGVQVALGANSPFFLGKELWRETRIPLFEQATDTRSEELKAQGVRPRVWFGERWINSIFDLFEENVRYFPALLPLCDAGGPGRGLRARRRPARWPS